MFMNLDEDYKNIFSNLSKANGKAYIKEFSCHSTVSFTGRLTYPAYKFLPTTYVITEGDKVIPPENQREMLAAAETDGSKITVQSLDAGHVPMVGVPEKVAEVLVSAARQA
jgi:pimeloyl-ACP methyl ester carboxylesterase